MLQISNALLSTWFRLRDYYHTCYCLSGLSIAQHFTEGKLKNEIIVGHENNKIVRLCLHWKRLVWLNPNGPLSHIAGRHPPTLQHQHTSCQQGTWTLQEHGCFRRRKQGMKALCFILVVSKPEQSFCFDSRKQMLQDRFDKLFCNVFC